MQQFTMRAILAIQLVVIAIEFSQAQIENGVDVVAGFLSYNSAPSTSFTQTKPDVIALPNPVRDPKDKVVLICRTRCGGTALVNIYDAVGSLVFHKALRLQKPDALGYRMCVPWDCRNRNGRIVGKGTYLGIIHIFDTENRPLARHMVNIGVAY